MLGAVDACCETHGSKALILQFRQFTASQCTAITVERERENQEDKGHWPRRIHLNQDFSCSA